MKSKIIFRLQIELENWFGDKMLVSHVGFYLENEKSLYRLHSGQHISTKLRDATDGAFREEDIHKEYSMFYHKKMFFQFFSIFIFFSFFPFFSFSSQFSMLFPPMALLSRTKTETFSAHTTATTMVGRKTAPKKWAAVFGTVTARIVI